MTKKKNKISNHHKRFHYPKIFEKLRRGGPAVILPKDAGAVIAYTGIGKDSIVVEIGSGTGFMTTFLANVSKEVITYEKREEFLKLSKENIEKNKIKNVRFIHKDAHNGLNEVEDKKVDLIFTDIPEPEGIIKEAFRILKKKGYLVSYCPNIEQAKRIHLDATKTFSEVFTIEINTREYEIREYGTRPKHIGLMHTAYLVFCRT